MPNWALSPLAMRFLNIGYLAGRGRRVWRGIAHPQSFFYPLDVVLEWNRAVRPARIHAISMRPAAQQRRFRTSGPLRHHRPARRVPGPSSWSRISGAEGRGRLSFPMPGVTFNIDLPVTSGTPRLVEALNDFVGAENGRIYLAKDAFTRGEQYRAMDPRIDGFNAIRRRWDPQGRIKSALSVRLLGDPA